MARLIDLPPEYVSGGRYLAAAPSKEEQFYKISSGINIDAVERILKFAETVGKSQLTGLAIKGIAKLYEMGQPSLADLQAQEAKLRMALDAEGKTAAEIEEEIAELKKASAALEKAYADEKELIAEGPFIPYSPTPPEEPFITRTTEVPIERRPMESMAGEPSTLYKDMYGGRVSVGVADAPLDTPPTEYVPQVAPGGGKEIVAGEEWGEEGVDWDSVPHVPGGGGDVYDEDPGLTKLHQQQAEIQRRIQAFQAERQAVAEAQRAKQAEIEAVQTQIAEVPTFRGQQMRTMDDIVAVASTASKEERGALLVAARNLATPSNLFDFDYKQDAMKKVTELFPTALDLRRESLTSTELRKTIATEKRADASMIKALKKNELMPLKKKQLEARIQLLEQDLRREPERLEKIRQQIENLKARTMASAAGTKFREAALKYKEKRMNLTQLKTFKQPIERIYLDQVKGLTTEINTWEKTKARASLNMTSLSEGLASGLGADEEAKLKHEANQALKAYKNASINITALRLARTKVTSIAHQIGKATSIEEVNAFITEHGAP